MTPHQAIILNVPGEILGHIFEFVVPDHVMYCRFRRDGVTLVCSHHVGDNDEDFGPHHACMVPMASPYYTLEHVTCKLFNEEAHRARRSRTIMYARAMWSDLSILPDAATSSNLYLPSATWIGLGELHLRLDVSGIDIIHLSASAEYIEEYSAEVRYELRNVSRAVRKLLDNTRPYKAAKTVREFHRVNDQGVLDKGKEALMYALRANGCPRATVNLDVNRRTNATGNPTVWANVLQAYLATTRPDQINAGGQESE